MKKPFVIECRSVEEPDTHSWKHIFYQRDWKIFKAYRTERGRDRAFDYFTRLYTFMEFRKVNK